MRRVLCFSELFFVKEPHDVTVMRKDPVILDCQAHGEAPIAVRWLKSGVRVAESERVYLLSNGSLYIAEVENRRADKTDEGFYQCLAQNKYGAILSQKARLTVAKRSWAAKRKSRMKTWPLATGAILRPQKEGCKAASGALSSSFHSAASNLAP
ncbi:hypothetical protein AAFF_G00087680 [Aldrovandia affinis]|uniref:Ig-like domain-containing protein n=1 Tax=Aldrovandia affinis TaxID=143900 RepID=A0AAD7RWN0_9TELE|nr:hypothetical protein AAFF_G00087680 [Aldrovandia affinis]